jgi:hypothetical protein
MDALTRREWLRLSGVALSGLWLGCGGRGPACDGSDACLPSLGGAPDSHEGRVIAAFCDTVVPGRHRDPTGAPGALDVGAAALFFDPALPALPLVDLLVTFLDGTAQRLHRADFDALAPAARDQVVEQALADLPPLELAIQLAKLAFYTSAGGQAALGYPGANPGYLDHPDFSFGTALTRELTRDGNLD